MGLIGYTQDEKRRLKSVPLQSPHSKHIVWMLILQLLHHILQIRIELSKKKKNRKKGKRVNAFLQQM